VSYIPPSSPASQDGRANASKRRRFFENEAVAISNSIENSNPGNVLLMRLRRASESARRTQTQIPFRVARVFFVNSTEVASSHSEEVHALNVAKARGDSNTLKLEIPEIESFNDIFVRFEKRSDERIYYQVFDENTSQGDSIKKSLLEGLDVGKTQT